MKDDTHHHRCTFKVSGRYLHPWLTSAVVIDKLRTLFAQFGLPKTIVTYKGTCFVSA